MTEIISVRFRPGGKQYYFDPTGLTVPEGCGVIVETGKGLEYGVCVRTNTNVEDEAVVQPLRPLVRLATEQDEKQVQENREREKEALRVCQQLVEHHGLDMKLVQVEYCFDGSKIIFFFTSDGRVDFRALVKDLAGIFRARIELRQIGVRDEARMLGGFGICGKPFCCAQFLNEFQPVSIKMAKTQNLSLNPTKISGTCGRLMCCLKYEQEAYEDAVKRCPKQDSFVECPDGVGTVTSVNLLKEQVKVRLDGSTEQPRNYLTREIRVVRSGKGKHPEGYVAPPKEELEKLRAPEAEERRTGRKPDGSTDLSAVLDRYLGTESDSKGGGPKKQSGGRRNHRSHGGRDSKPAPSGVPAAHQPQKQERSSNKPRTPAAPKGQGPQKPQQSKPQISQKPQQKNQPSQPKTPAAQKPQQAKAQAPQAAPKEPAGDKPKPNPNHKRHYRPHHRPKSGSGQAPQS